MTNFMKKLSDMIESNNDSFVKDVLLNTETKFVTNPEPTPIEVISYFSDEVYPNVGGDLTRVNRVVNNLIK